MTVCCNTVKFPLSPAHYFSNKADKKYLPTEMLDFELHFPTRRSGGSSSPSVMSFQSCGSTRDSQCNILSSPGHNSANSCFPLQRVRGILIVTGAMRVTF